VKACLRGMEEKACERELEHPRVYVRAIFVAGGKGMGGHNHRESAVEERGALRSICKHIYIPLSEQRRGVCLLRVEPNGRENTLEAS
jgi:hypothetical protein